jgi:hypothetical protein
MENNIFATDQSGMGTKGGQQDEGMRGAGQGQKNGQEDNN